MLDISVILGFIAQVSYFDLNVVVVFNSFSVSVYYKLIFRQETPPGSRLNCAYLSKKLNSTCIMAHQCEASTAPVLNY